MSYEMNQTIPQNEQQWQLLVLLLKEIAEQKGLTQQQIADASGLMRSNVNRLFALKFPPNIKTFLSVAQAVGVNFYFEDKESKIDLNIAFERAMESLGRRPGKLHKN
jgi:transcriptional regulator with XRE-family HTH domain